jgi:hypothetical protein
MNHTLESHKFFPYIAWTIIIGFAFFTYSLTLRMQTDLQDINISIDNLEEKINNMDATQKGVPIQPVQKVTPQ